MEEGAGLEQAVKTGTLSENLAVELFFSEAVRKEIRWRANIVND